MGELPKFARYHSDIPTFNDCIACYLMGWLQARLSCPHCVTVSVTKLLHSNDFQTFPGTAFSLPVYRQLVFQRMHVVLKTHCAHPLDVFFSWLGWPPRNYSSWTAVVDPVAQAPMPLGEAMLTTDQKIVTWQMGQDVRRATVTWYESNLV